MFFVTFSQIRAVSLREQVVEQIRTAIIEGRLKPNDHIVEGYLTSQLGISRTPVREALILLEGDGLVVSHPHRGCFVRNFTTQDVDEVFSMRTTLENFAGEIIMDVLSESDYQHLEALIETQSNAINSGDYKNVRSIDMRFHRYLVDKSRHDMLIHNWKQIVAQIAAVLYLRAEAIPNYDENLAIRDHKALVQMYRQHDLAGLFRHNRQINQRVAEECKFAIEYLTKAKEKA
jgi:DNA-binding GntR family transcriptional regulator